MAKMLVPALTLPVRGATELVATIPVPGVALGRAQRDPGPQRAGRVQQPGARLGRACRPARPAGGSSGSSVGQRQLDPGLGDQVVELGEHRRRRSRRCGVDREHAAGVADAEDLLAGQLPVHIAGQGGQVGDPADVVLVVQDRLVQVRDAPPVRDVVAEQRAQPLDRRPGVGVAPGPERGEQLTGGVEGEVAVHHRRHPQGADRGQLHPVPSPHVGGQGRVAVLHAGPDRVQRVRPQPVDELVLPAVAADRERCVVRRRSAPP